MHIHININIHIHIHTHTHTHIYTHTYTHTFLIFALVSKMSRAASYHKYNIKIKQMKKHLIRS